MAINFLNTVDLNKNQLNYAAIQNLTTNPAGAAVVGQIYFNTTDSELKIYAEIIPFTTPKTYQWEAVGGGVESIGDGTYTTVGGTAKIPVINHNATSRTDTTTTTAPGEEGTFPVVTTITTNATGHVTAINVDTITLPNNSTYSLPVSIGTAVASHSVADIDLTDDGGTIVSKVTFAGLDNGIKITETVGNDGIVNIALANGAYVNDTVGSGSNLVLPNGAVAITQASGDNTTKVATTEFVQNAVLGNLEFKGGFNATTGDLDAPLTTDLYTDTTIAIGDYYVVTTAGNFFGNAATPLTPGDSVIAQDAVASGSVAESNFIVVQSDTDLATLTTVGLAGIKDGVSGSGVTTTVSSGMFTLKVDPTKIAAGTVTNILGQVGTESVAKKISTTDLFSTRGKKILLADATAGVAFTATAGGEDVYVITLATAWAANIDGTNIQVEIMTTASPYDTVYAVVERSATTVTIRFANPITDGAYSVLLNNIG